VKAVGARSATIVALLVSVAVVMVRMDLVRADYWAQLDPWVTFIAAAFATLCGAVLTFGFRLGERSEYYLRFGERSPFGAEIPLFGTRDRSLIVGHAAHIEVLDFPRPVQRVAYVAILFALGLVAIDNRAVALLRDKPRAFAQAGSDVCPEPKPPEPPQAQPQGCKLVIRAYQLGYAKSLGNCGPKEPEEKKLADVCRKRQRDEPYLHYQWRLLQARAEELGKPDNKPGMFDRFGDQLEHLPALFHATADSVAMRPRSSHHLFTNLPDPHPSFREHIERRCGARLAQAPHFPPMEDTPVGRSLLLEHVVDQLVFNPIYKPVVAQCGEVIIHWDASVDACDKILEQTSAVDDIREVLGWRRRKSELAKLHMRELGEPAPADRVASVQCLMFGDKEEPTIDREVELDGDKVHVRRAATKELAADGGSQIRLYKRLADLFAEGFSYGHLTSNESIGAKPTNAALARTDTKQLLGKLDYLRDADVFLGNEWLLARSDLLDVYPYHLHLKNFVEIFRNQYKLHRGRL
jgi:hypothetical protein